MKAQILPRSGQFLLEKKESLLFCSVPWNCSWMPDNHDWTNFTLFYIQVDCFQKFGLTFISKFSTWLLRGQGMTMHPSESTVVIVPFLNMKKNNHDWANFVLFILKLIMSESSDWPSSTSPRFLTWLLMGWRTTMHPFRERCGNFPILECEKNNHDWAYNFTLFYSSRSCPRAWSTKRGRRCCWEETESTFLL